MSRKIIAGMILLAFFFNTITPAGAQLLPTPGTAIGLTASLSPRGSFQPPILLGLKVHPENPLLFDFIVDEGQTKLSQDELKSETEKLVKYFLAALTIPDKEVWVNLSPTERDRIIPDVLGQTVMGKTMLEQDYLLKQLAASLTNPETKLGAKYWDEVNKHAPRPDGLSTSSDISSSVVSKVWIVPAKAEVLESNGIVLVGEKRLKVMMDEERSNQKDRWESPADAGANADQFSVSSQIFRDTILPNIEKEVNEGKNFADVRQIYNSVILAAWYKKALKESLLGQVYTDKGKVAGIETDDKEMKQHIYEQYLAAFKKGAYNLIKEEEDPVTGDMIPRKYFSGGAIFADVPLNVTAGSPLTMQKQLSASSGIGIHDAKVQLGTEGQETKLLTQRANGASSPITNNNASSNQEYQRQLLALVDTLFTSLLQGQEANITEDVRDVIILIVKEATRLYQVGHPWTKEIVINKGLSTALTLSNNGISNIIENIYLPRNAEVLEKIGIHVIAEPNGETLILEQKVFDTVEIQGAKFIKIMTAEAARRNAPGEDQVTQETKLFFDQEIRTLLLDFQRTQENFSTTSVIFNIFVVPFLSTSMFSDTNHIRKKLSTIAHIGPALTQSFERIVKHFGEQDAPAIFAHIMGDVATVLDQVSVNYNYELKAHLETASRSLAIHIVQEHMQDDFIKFMAEVAFNFGLGTPLNNDSIEQEVSAFIPKKKEFATMILDTLDVAGAHPQNQEKDFIKILFRTQVLLAASSALFTLAPGVVVKLDELKTRPELSNTVKDYLTEDVLREILSAIHYTFSSSKWTSKYKDEIVLHYDPRPGSSYQLQQARELIAKEMLGMQKDGNEFYFRENGTYPSYADFLAKLEKAGYLIPSLGGIEESLAKAESVQIGELIPISDAIKIIRQFRIAKTPVPLSAVLTFAKYVGRLKLEEVKKDNNPKYSLETLKAAEKILTELFRAYNDLIDIKEKNSEERAFYQKLVTQMNFALRKLKAIIVVRYNENGEKILDGDEARLKVALEWANDVEKSEFISIEAANLIMQYADSYHITEIPYSALITIIEAARRNPNLYQGARAGILQDVQQRLSIIEQEQATIKVAKQQQQEQQRRQAQADAQQRKREVQAMLRSEVHKADIMSATGERFDNVIKIYGDVPGNAGFRSLLTREEAALLLVLIKKATPEKTTVQYNIESDVDLSAPNAQDLIKARAFLADRLFGMTMRTDGRFEFLDPFTGKPVNFKNFIKEEFATYALVGKDAEAKIDAVIAASSGISVAEDKIKTVSAPAIEPVGGIDFDPTNMNLQIKRDGKGVPLPLPQQNLQQINIQGLFPVIINIVPINAQTLPIFLSQAPQTELETKEPPKEEQFAGT